MRLNYRLVALLALIGLAVAAGVILLSVPSQKDKADKAWSRVQASGTLRVGMDASYPPFEFLDADNQIVGFDVDLAREIGRRLGLEVQFVNIAYDGLYDALLTDQVDVLISALAAVPQFEGRAVFSPPYFNAGERLVVRSGSPIQAMADMEGRTLAVEYGSGGDVEARQWERRLADLSIKRYADPGAALLAVIHGEADAALVDGISAEIGVGEHAELALGERVIDSLFAVAIPLKSPTLKQHLNETLDAMLEDGTVAALRDKWFGFQQGD